jgi:hypothetical protein
MRLQQGQLWRTKTGFIRITYLERFGVEFKTMLNVQDGAGEHHEATKKVFCRLLKGATLLETAPAEASQPDA